MIIQIIVDEWIIPTSNSDLVSFLYYFGVLTILEDTEDLKVILKVPDLVMKSLYVERIQKMLYIVQREDCV